MIDAAEIARALKAKRVGRGWAAKCPAHDDRDPSLSINVSRDGGVLVHCFGGCSQEMVIAAADTAAVALHSRKIMISGNSYSIGACVHTSGRYQPGPGTRRRPKNG